MPTQNQKPTVNPEEVVETPEVSSLDKSETILVSTYVNSVVALIKAEEDHNAAGLNIIDMFEQARLRMLESKEFPSREVPKRIYDSAIIVLTTMDISDKVQKRASAELKSVFIYYENGLQLRHRAISFTLFAKIVKLFHEAPKIMTKSRIKALLSTFKGKDATKMTAAQIVELDKKYEDRCKNLVIKVEAQKLAGEFDAENVPNGFQAILAGMMESADKGMVNNMIAGLRVALNNSEGTYKAPATKAS